MVGPNHPGIRFRFTIPMIRHRPRERSPQSSPIVVTNDIEILIKSWLGLFIDYAEDLADRAGPWW
jgi:hypothetical protein